MLALTPTEAAALTGLDERAVRKDVEHGILDAGTPPRFAEVALVYLQARASFTFHLDARDRKRLYSDIADALERGHRRVDLGPGWTLDVAAVASDLRRRVADFEAWRCSLVTRDDILGGEPVFPGSRLAVRHVGEMLARGADVGEVREDYAELTERDIEFARIFAVAYPRIGRPRGQAAAG
jgi:uncharacterized protein (DUF433 family)